MHGFCNMPSWIKNGPFELIKPGPSVMKLAVINSSEENRFTVHLDVNYFLIPTIITLNPQPICSIISVAYNQPSIEITFVDIQATIIMVTCTDYPQLIGLFSKSR